MVIAVGKTSAAILVSILLVIGILGVIAVIGSSSQAADHEQAGGGADDPGHELTLGASGRDEADLERR
jgi:hypothetical protein